MMKPILSLVLSLGLLAGCTLNEQITNDIERTEEKTRAALSEIEPKKEFSRPLIVDERPWFGANAVPVSEGDPLPAKFNKPDSLVITFASALSMDELRSEIQKVTGLSVIVDKTSGESVTRSRFLPSDGLQVTGGRVVWQGSLEDLLNQMADEFDAGWTYKNGMIRIYQEISKTFMLHALAADVTVSGSLEAGASSSGGSLPEVGIEDNATLDIWDEIEETINNILDDQGRVSMSPSTGTITISASPTLVSRAEEYLRKQNRLRLRRVAVSVQVLAVDVNNTSSYGFDLFAQIENAIGSQPFELSNTNGSLNVGIIRKSDLGAGAVDDFSALLSASEDINRVTVSNSGAVVTLSDQPAPLQIGRQITYLERVSSSTSDGGTGVSLEPGTVDVGLTMNILPRVIEDNRVLMRLALALTDAEEPFETFTSSDATIQLPEIETTGFLQNAVLSQGETLVLAGFERRQAGISDDRYLSWLFGGTRTLDRNREMTVLLISAEILPEEPMQVIDNYYD